MSARDLTVRGVRTRIEEEGDGPPLLLVHGLGGPMMWERTVPLLSPAFRVVTVHLPGFGESDPPSRPYTTADYAAFLSDLLDALGIRQACVAGISYGAQAALLLAAAHPGRVGKLVLVAASGLSAHPVLRRTLAWSLVSWPARNIFFRSERLLCAFGRLSFYDPAKRPADLCRRFYRQMTLPGKTESWLNALGNSLREGGDAFRREAGSLNVPALILWGACDRFLPPKIASEFHRTIPGSRMQVLEACGHSLPLEKPGETARAIREFIG